MGSKVVIDLTTVYTLSLLEPPDRDRFVGAFYDLSTTDIQFNDLVQAAVNISLDEGSSIGWDPVRNSLRVLDQPERAVRNSQAIAVVREILANLTRRPWPELKQLSDFDATEPWISVVDFATLPRRRKCRSGVTISTFVNWPGRATFMRSRLRMSLSN